MIIEKLDKAHISYSAGSPRRIVVKRYPDGRLSSGSGISGDNNRWNTVHTVGAIIIQSPISAREFGFSECEYTLWDRREGEPPSIQKIVRDGRPSPAHRADDSLRIATAEDEAAIENIDRKIVALQKARKKACAAAFKRGRVLTEADVLSRAEIKVITKGA